MAEVVIAVADTLKWIAISVSVVALVGLVYAVMAKLWPLVPYMGAAHVAGLGYMVFKGINPIMGLGGALALAAFVYPLLQAVTMNYKGNTDPASPSGVAAELEGSAMVMAGGLGMGLGYSIAGESLTIAVLGAAAGAFLGKRYLWNGLINFFIGAGFLPKGAGCNSVTQNTAWKAWQAQNGTLCTKPEYAAYCAAMQKWFMICPRASAGSPPTPPSGSGGAGEPSAECAVYPPFGGETGIAGDFTYYVATGQVVAGEAPWGPGQAADWIFMNEDPGWVWSTMPSPGILVVSPNASQSQLAQTLWYFSDGWYSDLDDGGKGKAIGGPLQPGGIYAFQCSGRSKGDFNIQGPLSPSKETFTYQTFGPKDGVNAPTGPYQGWNVCAPAIKQSVGPITSFIPQYKWDVQPQMQDRPLFGQSETKLSYLYAGEDAQQNRSYQYGPKLGLSSSQLSPATPLPFPKTPGN